MNSDDLLTRICRERNATYVSDIKHTLTMKQLKQLKERIGSENYSKAEWEEAFDYCLK